MDRTIYNKVLFLLSTAPFYCGVLIAVKWDKISFSNKYATNSSERALKLGATNVGISTIADKRPSFETTQSEIAQLTYRLDSGGLIVGVEFVEHKSMTKPYESQAIGEPLKARKSSAKRNLPKGQKTKCVDSTPEVSTRPG
ncbi:hypothetical protein L484_014747 [Morus notabilis]|uniref:Uncharacterized protein n=1 Tax=Morus notabilis TaxID=981085 RepID=W9QEV9_9ROSA|nr:hypothetical protein L484_014747 [Morus notabilis]